MKPIDYIRQKVAQTLNIDPPDEVFRPALEKAIYKALSQHSFPNALFQVHLDWLAMVVCENIQIDLLSIQRRKEMEEKINGTVSS